MITLIEDIIKLSQLDENSFADHEEPWISSPWRSLLPKD